MLGNLSYSLQKNNSLAFKIKNVILWNSSITPGDELFTISPQVQKFKAEHLKTHW